MILWVYTLYVLLQVHPIILNDDNSVLSSSLPAVLSEPSDIAINVDNIDVSSLYQHLWYNCADVLFH